MTLLARNEEDIVRENIEFHLNQGIDFIIATDNKSTDSTALILKEYEKKGVLRYIHENKDTHDQGTWVTRMARLAYTNHSANWVINNDCDEFWWPSRHKDLKTALNSLPQEYNIVQAKRNNFVPLKEQWPNSPFYNQMHYKELISLNSEGRPLPPKQAHKSIKDIIVDNGNHGVHGFDNPNICKDLIEIFHFPIRGKKQFTNKIINGGAALERNTKLSKNTGITWRNLYEQLQKDGNLDSYLNKNLYDNNRINSSLAKNSITKDTRLMEYLQKIL